MTMRRSLAVVLSLVLAPPAALSQPPAAELSRAVADWREAHGAGWRLRVDPQTHTARALFGGSCRAGDAPRDDAGWVELARAQVESARGIFQVASETLVPVGVKHIALSAIGTTDKTGVVFEQRVHGVAVVGGRVAVLFGPQAELLAIDATAVPRAELVEDRAAVPADLAMGVARREFEVLEGRAALAASEPELVIFPQVVGDVLQARLAWSADLSAPRADRELPSRQRVFVAADAVDVEILATRQLVHRFQSQSTVRTNQQCRSLSGIVRTMATPGQQASWSGNPPQLMPASNLLATSAAGSDLTDANGLFRVSYSGAGSVPFTFDFVSPYVRVENLAGSAYRMVGNVLPNDIQSWDLNQPPAEHVTAEANAFIHVNRFRDYVLGLDPTDHTFDFQVLARVNANFSCNAYFDYASIVFARDERDLLMGIRPDLHRAEYCHNTAFSTIIAHEEGHWANELYGSGNGDDGFGEGAADTWAMYIYDTPIVGEYFFHDGGHVRTGENTRKLCQVPGCYLEVHDDGEVLMGALWKVRRNLNDKLGDALGDLTADRLFLTWMQVFADTQITPLVQEHWLLLDDDDGDLTNLTPHFGPIDRGFMEQGFPDFVATLPVKVLAADGAQGDGFGRSIAADGRTVIVGAPRDRTGAPSVGAAYVMHQTKSGAGADARLTPPTGTLGDHFGECVALRGGFAAVGAPGDSANGFDAGAAYVFLRSSSGWRPQPTVYASDAHALAGFGCALAIDGGTLVVGSRANTVYVYVRDSSGWTEQARLTNAAAGFGGAVALFEDQILVGADRDSQGGKSEAGSAFVYARSGISWTLQATLSARDAAPYDHFGRSVALDGNSAVVGAPDQDAGGAESGSVYVFAPAAGWTQRQRLVASDGAVGDRFGTGLALEDNRLVVGAPLKTSAAGNQAGAAYDFVRGAERWLEVARLLAPDGASQDYFGAAVALDGTWAAFGAPFDDDLGNDSGSAYVKSIP